MTGLADDIRRGKKREEVEKRKGRKRWEEVGREKKIVKEDCRKQILWIIRKISKGGKIKNTEELNP